MRMRLTEQVARIEKMRNAYRFLVRKPEGKGPAGRSWRTWENNLKLNLGEVGCDNVHC